MRDGTTFLDDAKEPYLLPLLHASFLTHPGAFIDICSVCVLSGLGRCKRIYHLLHQSPQQRHH